ncbi:MAG: hypothetical protein GH144_01175 [Clostridia bacterium]|jgi:hypothetical protein|nr:hypothetical protein [Clostridia bacterium]
MAKKKHTKKEERIIDKPTKKQVKDLIKRAEEMAKNPDKKKTPASKKPVHKIDLVLTKLGAMEKTLTKYTKKTDTIEILLSNKDSQEQKAQTKLSSEEELAKIQAEQDKEKAQGKQQPGQQPGQAQGKLTPEEQKVIGATQQFQQDIGTAQAAQTEAQKAGQQPQPGQVLTPQGAWLLERASHAAEIILPAFFQSKGSNTGTPLKAFFDQLKIYQSIESTIMGGFFNFMKNLSPQQRQVTMDNIATSAPTPTMTNLPPKSEFIQ